MSRNQEIKFVAWWEAYILPEYREREENFFLDDEWFASLPKSLQDIIIKVDSSSWEDEDYDWDLVELEQEIKAYIFQEKRGNYHAEGVPYLFDFLDFASGFDEEEEDDDDEME